jgi:hypothetical protein
VSMIYLAQPDQQQQLEWLDGGTLARLLDGKATDGQLMVGRFDVSEGEAPPFHKHLNEDEVFLLITGTTPSGGTTSRTTNWPTAASFTSPGASFAPTASRQQRLTC